MAAQTVTVCFCDGPKAGVGAHRSVVSVCGTHPLSQHTVMMILLLLPHLRHCVCVLCVSLMTTHLESNTNGLDHCNQVGVKHHAGAEHIQLALCEHIIDSNNPQQQQQRSAMHACMPVCRLTTFIHYCWCSQCVVTCSAQLPQLNWGVCKRSRSSSSNKALLNTPF